MTCDSKRCTYENIEGEKLEEVYSTADTVSFVRLNTLVEVEVT